MNENLIIKLMLLRRNISLQNCRYLDMSRWVGFHNIFSNSAVYVMQSARLTCAQRFACMCSSGLEALSFPFAQKFLKRTDFRFTTSPAIATYTLLAVRCSVLRYVRCLIAKLSA